MRESLEPIALAYLKIGSALLLALLLFSSGAQAQDWSWQTETVDNSAKATSLAADANNNIHLSYGNDAGLNYAFRPAGSSKWFHMVVGGTVNYTNIKADAQGNAHICSTYRRLVYSHFDGKKWESQEIASDAATIGFSCSLAIGADGTPHIAWYRDQNADLTIYAHLKYAELQGGVWVIRTLDFDPQTGKWSTMVLDAKGNPYVSYDGFVKGDAKVAHWDGKNWIIKVLDSRGTEGGAYNIGMGNSIAIDSSGNILVSYYTESKLKFVRLNGDHLNGETVDLVNPDGGWIGYRSTLALDSRGLPHIAYEDGRTLKHAYWDGSKWRINVIARGGTESYRHSSMAIDKNDNIFMSYRDLDDGSLKVAVGLRNSKQPAELTQKGKD